MDNINDLVPLQETCPVNDPQRFALWALYSIPELNADKGVPILPVDALKLVSVHLYQCGLRFVPDAQVRFPHYSDPENPTVATWEEKPPKTPSVGDISKAAKAAGLPTNVIADALQEIAHKLR